MNVVIKNQRVFGVHMILIILLFIYRNVNLKKVIKYMGVFVVRNVLVHI